MNERFIALNTYVGNKNMSDSSSREHLHVERGCSVMIRHLYLASQQKTGDMFVGGDFNARVNNVRHTCLNCQWILWAAVDVWADFWWRSRVHAIFGLITLKWEWSIDKHTAPCGDTQTASHKTHTTTIIIIPLSPIITIAYFSNIPTRVWVVKCGRYVIDDVVRHRVYFGCNRDQRIGFRGFQVTMARFGWKAF